MWPYEQACHDGADSGRVVELIGCEVVDLLERGADPRRVHHAVRPRAGGDVARHQLLILARLAASGVHDPPALQELRDGVIRALFFSSFLIKVHGEQAFFN